jgi:hypothetical protein
MKMFFKRLFKTEDELIGHWETSNEGGFQMLGGSKLDLHPDGTGSLVSWGLGQDEPFEYSDKLFWERVNNKTIKIKLENDKEFSTVSYLLKDHSDAYSIKYAKLYDPNYKLKHLNILGLWRVSGELYRRR